jgi:methionyl-tRNA formyltransferase
LLDTPLRGFVNVHASLLPRWRGAAPVHRAVIAGDATTGVTIMRVVLALDAGPTLGTAATPIAPEETSEDLEARLSRIGADLLISTLAGLEAGSLVEIPQDEDRATYATRLTREDSHVDWHRSAHEIHNQIRGLHPWPLMHGMLHERRVIVRRSVVLPTAVAAAPPGTIVEAHGDRLVVATGLNLLQLTPLQPEGGRPLDARAFLNGARVKPGDRFCPMPGAR